MASVPEPTPVWRLIQAARNRTKPELSYRWIESHSHGRLSRSALLRYRNDQVKQLAPGTLKAISETLDIPLTDLVRAMLETLGLRDALGAQSTEDAINGDDTIPELTKRQMLRLLAIARELDEAAYTPGPPAGSTPTD